MEKIFDFISDNPIILALLIVAVVLIIVFKKKKSARESDDKGGSPNSSGAWAEIEAYASEIGETDKMVVTPKARKNQYYRYQEDTQITINRTNEQQRVFDEYFVIKNYATITCQSSLKKSAKIAKIASISLLILGVALWLLEGDSTYLISAAVAVIAYVVHMLIAKRFRASIKCTIAPKKVMTHSEFEKLVEDKIVSMNVEQLGLDKLGLDPEQVSEVRPIVLRNKVLDKRSLTVYDKNAHEVHSSTQHVTYLYFTNDQLFVYQLQFDMCCNKQKEWTSEFFYKDICDISSITRKNTLQGESNGEKFIYEYSRVTCEIIVTNSKFWFELDGKNANLDSILALKHKIRDRKNQ